MLVSEPFRYRVTDFDRDVFRRFVPDEHPLAVAEREIHWEEFRPLLEKFYSQNSGQPALDPVRMLKLEYLRYQHNLSDRQVMERTKTDLAFRYFLQVGYTFETPDPSFLTRFRGRLGVQGFTEIFDQLVAQARQAGLVKDRLRLKDASHVIAHIEIPTTLALVAEIRDGLLTALEPLDLEWVTGQRVEVELLRKRTANQADAVRLAARVTHLREIVAWSQALPEPPPMCLGGGPTDPAWQKFLQTRELAEKILQDRDHPEAGRKTLSVSDPEARRGKHGAWYEGYVTDVMMDADSELLTQIHLLEAGGDEARDAVELIRAEEQAHGNDIQALSIDGAGFNGEMLRELEGAAGVAGEEGLGVTTYVPPKAEPTSPRFSPSEFTVNAERTAVTCPAGQTSQYQQRDKNATVFRFTRATCDACPLLRQCVAKPGQGAFGRTVTKNDYELEYQRARERAQTEEYAGVRKEHPAIERKFNELMNHHGGRHARYWGKAKVHIQQMMTGFVVNTKRMIHLLAELRAEPT
jgi:transposase